MVSSFARGLAYDEAVIRNNRSTSSGYVLLEIIKGVLWDGGLKQICNHCGIKGELVQWQDIHIMLLSTYETLLELSLDTFKATTHVVRVGYWDWIQSLTIESNKNEISRFWSQILIVLHLYTGFYFSIRSGNWTLRN